MSRSAEIRPTFNGRLTLFIKFEIHGGPYDGAELFFAIPLPPRDRHGRSKAVAPSSKLYRAWVVASGGQKPTRRDRLTLEAFKHRLFRVVVRTVTHDSEQRELPKDQRYSVIDRLLERLA